MNSKVVCKNGNMIVWIDGKEYSFAGVRSFRPQGSVLKDFSEHDIKFFNIFPSGIMTALCNRTVPYSQFGPVWIGENEYNWDNLKAQCNEVFGSISDDDYVSVNVHLDPPSWFVEQNDGFVDHWEQMIQNVGSEKWRKSASNYLCALVDKLDEWYPNRVYAIFLMCGGTTEWYSYHVDKVIENPTSLHIENFRKYVGDNKVEIPTKEILYSACDGFIRSKNADFSAIRYWNFVNDAVMDTVLYFAKVAKEHTKNSKIVGLFSGHIWGQTLDFAVQTSYNRLDKLLKSEYIDMLFCPASYLFRSLTSTSALRVPIDSINLHKKLFSHEIDSSTHLLKKSTDKAIISHAGRDAQFTCTGDTIGYIKREVALALSKGQGYWWFDMFSGYYDDEELMNEIKKLYQIQQEVQLLPYKSVSEVVEFLDEPSNYMLKTKSYYPMVEHQSEALYFCSVPWDARMTFDFFHEDYSDENYKLYYFPVLFAPNNDVIDKIQSLRKAGKNMLYCHAPYYAVDNDLSVDNMEKYTGITFERVELVDNTVRLCFDGATDITYNFSNKSVKGDTWFHQGDEPVTPIFSPTNLDVVLGRFEENGKPACGIKFRKDGGFDAFSACAPLPKELIAKIYEYAKIFKYADDNVPVYTSSSFMAVYSAKGGEVTLYRPQKSTFIDCYTNEEIVLDENGTKVKFSPRETRYFKLKV